MRRLYGIFRVQEITSALIDLETCTCDSRPHQSFDTFPKSARETVRNTVHSMSDQDQEVFFSALSDIIAGDRVGKTSRGKPMPVREGATPVASSSEGLEEEGYAANLAAKLRHLPEEAQHATSSALRDSGVVAWSLDEIRPPSVPVTNSFELTDDRPNHSGARRLPPRQTKVVREELNKILEAVIITTSKSAWSFRVVIDTKMDGKSRFSVDCRALNQRMKADRWPLPKIEEIFDELQGSKVFTTLDMFSGCWQVRMEESCREKTSFVGRIGTFQFEVMPFGLMNALPLYVSKDDGPCDP